MNSIPRIASFHHQSISTTVAGAVTEFPMTLGDLVADYADDSGFAELRYELDHEYRLLDNDTNQQISAAIKNILTSKNELGRKRIIFKRLLFIDQFLIPYFEHANLNNIVILRGTFSSTSDPIQR